MWQVLQLVSSGGCVSAEELLQVYIYVCMSIGTRCGLYICMYIYRYST